MSIQTMIISGAVLVMVYSGLSRTLPHAYLEFALHMGGGRTTQDEAEILKNGRRLSGAAAVVCALGFYEFFSIFGLLYGLLGLGMILLIGFVTIRHQLLPQNGEPKN
jgi:hypothetical protein